MRLLYVFLLCFFGANDQGRADAVDDSINKIDTYRYILEKDAQKYESIYPEQAKTIVKWRVGWGQLVDLADASYYLDVADATLDRMEKRLEYLEAPYSLYRLGQHFDKLAISAIIASEMIALLDASKIRPAILSGSCAEDWRRSFFRKVPLNTILKEVAPDVGSFPLMQVHPTLKVNFIFSEGGDVSMSPAPYSPEEGQSGMNEAWGIPGIASTVSAAAYWQFSPSPSTLPAAAIAIFVYVMAVEMQNRYNDARIADAVKRLLEVIDRIKSSQAKTYADINEEYATIINQVCSESFVEGISILLDRLSNHNKRLFNINDRFKKLRLGTSAEISNIEDWRIIECEIFECGGKSELFTKSPRDLTHALINAIRVDRQER